MEINRKELILGYCPGCNEFFWDFGEKTCPNSRSYCKCKGPYQKILMREVNEKWEKE